MLILVPNHLRGAADRHTTAIFFIPPLAVCAAAFCIAERSNTSGRMAAALLAILLLIVIGFTMLIGNVPLVIAPANITLCKSNIYNIHNALEIYSTRNDGKYPDSLKALTPSNLPSLPRCTCAKYHLTALATGRMTSSAANWNQKTVSHYAKLYGINFEEYDYKVSDDQKAYTISCSGNNHPQLHIINVNVFSSKTGFIENL